MHHVYYRHLYACIEKNKSENRVTSPYVYCKAIQKIMFTFKEWVIISILYQGNSKWTKNNFLAFGLKALSYWFLLLHID